MTPLAQPAPACDHQRGRLRPQEFPRVGVRHQGVLYRPDGAELGQGVVGLRGRDAEIHLQARPDQPAVQDVIDEVGWYAQPVPLLHDTHPSIWFEARSCSNFYDTRHYIFEWQVLRLSCGQFAKFPFWNNGVNTDYDVASCRHNHRNSSRITCSGAGSRRWTVLPPAPQHGRHHGAERLPGIEFRWRGGAPQRCARGRAISPTQPRLVRTYSFELQNYTHRKIHVWSPRANAVDCVSRQTPTTGHDAWSAPIQGQISRGTA
jgi:hypothetical protein